MNSDRTFIENNIEDNFCQKHEKCLSCKYNTVRKKSTDNFNMYNCEAEVDKFQTDLERNIKFGLDDEIISELAYGELLRKIKSGYGFYLFERSEL